MPQKLSYDEVKVLAEDLGYTLISENYVNSRSKLTVEKDGYYGLTNVNSLRSKEEFSPWSKFNPYSIQNIKEYLRRRGSESELLETEYRGNKQKLKFRCKCGKEFYRCMSDMPSTLYIECRDCTVERRAEKRRFSLEEVKREFASRGYKIFSGEYKTINSRFEVENAEGYRGTISFKSAKDGNSLNIFAPSFAQKWYVYNLNKWLKDSNREIVVLDYDKEIGEFSTRLLTCKCPLCSKIFKTTIANLRAGKECCDECGKLYSGYSVKVEEWLKENQIEYVREKRFPDCIDIQELPFDFYLPGLNTCIEVDGEGHYKPTRFKGASEEKAEKTFKKTKLHDKMKDEYCLAKGIRIIRIPYWDFQYDAYKEILTNILKS